MKRILLFQMLLLSTISSYCQTTFNDIKPILIEYCATCHRVGGGAPFDILDYETASIWQSAILHEVYEGYMPPWQADTSYMHFIGEREITEDAKNAIIAWVQDGAIEGDDVVVETPEYPASLLNGVPDLVLTMTPFPSNASSRDAYNTMVIPTGLNSEKIIKAVEIIPDNPEFTHHVIVNANEGGVITNDLSGNAYNLQGSIAVGTYAPGANPIVYPSSDEIKMGVALPAGADLVLQVHTPNRYSGGASLGKDIGLKVKLFFYSDEEANEVRSVYSLTPLQYWSSDFRIPAGTKRTFEVEEEVSEFSVYDLSLFSIFPHSHQICTDIINYAFKGTDTIPLIRIDGWDFEHQENYYFKKMVKIPRDYTLKSIHDFDNTSANHHNPFDPPQDISVGFDSDDEMIFDGIQIMIYEEGDELINIDSILSNDPLLNYDTVIEAGIASIQLKNSYVYPNPAAGQAKIFFNYDHSNWNEYSIQLKDIQGKQIEVETSIQSGFIVIERGITPNGIYIYSIYEDDQLRSVGKIIFE